MSTDKQLAVRRLIMNMDVATGFIWFASFLFASTVHEAMHALAAVGRALPAARWRIMRLPRATSRRME